MDAFWKFVQVISPALIGLFGVVVGGWVTVWREKKSDARKAAKETAYLAAIVGGELDGFASQCADVVDDPGYTDKDGYKRAGVKRPTFTPSKFDVDWRSIPSKDMFDILDLPYQIEFANSAIEAVTTHSDSPYDFELTFSERRLQYARLGLHAAEIANRIRTAAKQKPRAKTYEWDPIARFTADIKKFEAERK
ncbi:hypothetical protein I5U02_02035 [Stenotrophomonas maltophilia]|nr:hypothetical protein [Stenotrophomonas maltophilia]